MKPAIGSPLRSFVLGLALVGAPMAAPARAADPPVLTGKDALGDWTTDAPGVRRKVTLDDLPPPYDTPSVDNGPRLVPRPAGASPKVPKGFTVAEFARGFQQPRVIVTAPNGDAFVADSAAGRIKVLRD